MVNVLDTSAEEEQIESAEPVDFLGTVITTKDGPSVLNFSFVMEKPVRQGEFVSVKTQEGSLLARVEDVLKANKYFESAGAVQEYARNSNLRDSFPVKEWEYTIALCRALGVYRADSKHADRPTYPPAPGTKISKVEPNVLDKFLGLDQTNGLYLGKVFGVNLKANINLGKLIKKHLAILAISGAGKSYTTGVLIEELLSRSPEQGRIALVILDTHGEYEYLKNSVFGKNVEVIDAKDIRIGISRFKAWHFGKLFPAMSATQQRNLDNVINQMKEKGINYDLRLLIDTVASDDGIKTTVKEPLVAWLSHMNRMNIFTSADYPNIQTIVAPGKAVVINLKGMIDNRKKQIIADHISRILFNLRRENKVPPYLEIIEEAHNFCPADSRSDEAVARSIIRTLAREGRKFNANICLISQRPVQLDTTALSQCNTQLIMKITNPNDLLQIKESAEAISTSTLNMISGLRVGEGLIIGSAVNHPILIKVRKRSASPNNELSLEDEARLYEKTKGNNLTKASDFV